PRLPRAAPAPRARGVWRRAVHAARVRGGRGPAAAAGTVGDPRRRDRLRAALRRARAGEQDEGAAHGALELRAPGEAALGALDALQPREPRPARGGAPAVKLAIVVGTRPEIVKMAPVLRAAVARGLRPLLVHTGQHYSFELDEVFFRELGLPEADVNLRVGSGGGAGQLAAIGRGTAAWVARGRPDRVLVEGDTNSVLGAALAAHKSGVRVGHVEAGLRSFDRSMPEELNRILTDHVSDLLFAPTERAAARLATEGIAPGRVRVTGNTV